MQCGFLFKPFEILPAPNMRDVIPQFNDLTSLQGNGLGS